MHEDRGNLGIRDTCRDRTSVLSKEKASSQTAHSSQTAPMTLGIRPAAPLTVMMHDAGPSANKSWQFLIPRRSKSQKLHTDSLAGVAATRWDILNELFQKAC